jgi:uncharacterized protein
VGINITITIDDVILEANLNESPIAVALADRLPAEIRMSRWGDEYYGAIGLGMANDAITREEVELGTLAYWPTGDALCLFFGPTPMSSGEKPRAASAVSVIGTVVSGAVDNLRPLGPSVTARLDRSQSAMTRPITDDL